MLVCLFLSKSFIFQGLNPVFSRPVLHYEVFKVPLCFSATACLVYTTQSFLSRTFLEFFKFFLSSLLSCGSAQLLTGLKNQGFYLPCFQALTYITTLNKIVNTFFAIFLILFLSVCDRICRPCLFLHFALGFSLLTRDRRGKCF